VSKMGGISVFIRFFSRKIGFWVNRAKNSNPDKERETNQIEAEIPDEEEPLPVADAALLEQLVRMKSIFSDCNDLVIREFEAGGLKCALCFIDGLVNMVTVQESVLRPMMEFGALEGAQALFLGGQIADRVLNAGEVKKVSSAGEAADACMEGDVLLFVEGSEDIIIINARGWEKRNVAEAQSEAVIRGPREGFTENFRTNTALLRRRIKTPMFKMKNMQIGRQTKTSVCIAYIDGIAAPEVVKKVEERLESIDIDSVMDSGYIEEYIEDSPFSIFPTIAYTEKPDVAAAKILEGRVAIIVDGSPFVLTAPMLFIESFQTAEDYYSRAIFSSITRLMRYLAYFITVFGPAVYIALVSFHQEFIPTTLLFSIAAAKEGTPFPAAAETLVMVFAFELLKEAGIRLPKAVGQAISIVGALIMGEAAVSAGIVGAPLVITIAIMGVAGFAIPEQNEAISVMRIIAIAFAASLGGFGIAMCFLCMLIHISSLESFGVPYYASTSLSGEIQDSYVRYPLWAMVKRPKSIAQGNITRRRFMIPPYKPDKKGAGEKIAEKLEERREE
jgi:spore germination protein KA